MTLMDVSMESRNQTQVTHHPASVCERVHVRVSHVESITMKEE